MDVAALKIAFAGYLFGDPTNPFLAATSIFPDDIGEACKVALEWPSDADVINELNRLKEIKPKFNIPEKEDIIIAAWNLSKTAFEAKDRVAALRLLAEIGGHMPDKTINKNVKTEGTSVNKVMLVKDHGENGDWEQAIFEQQSRLINEN